MRWCGLGLKTLWVFVVTVCLTVGGHLGYLVGRDNATVPGVSTSGLSLPIYISLLIENGKTNEALKTLALQVDANLAAALQLNQSALVRRPNRRVLEESIQRALIFHQKHPYVWINSEDAPRHVRHLLDAALKRSGASPVTNPPAAWRGMGFSGMLMPPTNSIPTAKTRPTPTPPTANSP